MVQQNTNNPVEIATLKQNTLFSLQKNISTTNSSIIIWQDPTFIGFVKLSETNLEIQPEGPAQLDFVLFQDLRLIGNKGEYHLWRQPEGGIMARLRLHSDLTNDEIIKDQHYLWGTNFCRHGNNIPDWSCVSEERGMRLWLPWAHTGALPVYMPVWHIIEQDSSGLAAIVDSIFLLPTQLEQQL